METYARELIPALDRACPTSASRRSSTRGRGRRRALWRCARSRHRAGRRAKACQTGYEENSISCPGLAAAHGVDLLHSLGSTAPAWGAFRRVVTIHDVIYRIFPEAHIRTQGTRDERARPARRASLASGHRPVRRTRGTISSSSSTYLAEQDRRRPARCRLAPASSHPKRSRAPLAPRDSDNRRVVLTALGQAARTRTSSRLLDAWRSSRASSARAHPPRLPDAARSRARAARRASSGSTRTPVPRLGRRRRISRASTRSPSCFVFPRSTRGSACRCSRRWRAAFPSRALPAARSVRSPAAPRSLFDPESPRAIARGGRAASCATRADVARKAPPCRPRAREPLHVERDGARRPSRTYERALAGSA